MLALKKTFLMTTAVNTFDVNKKAIKAKVLIADGVKIAGGWKKYIPESGNGGSMGTGNNLICNEWRYKVENGTCHMYIHMQKTAATTGNATGTGVYTFSYPPGCTPKYAGTATQNRHGTILLSGATKLFRGYFNTSSTAITVYIHTAIDAATVWSDASDAEIVMGVAGALHISGELMFELSDTCAAKAVETV